MMIKNSFSGNDFVEFVENMHWHIFHSHISDAMKRFLENLSISFFFGIFTTSILFVVNIFAGRLLGPEGYGEYNYLYSIAGTCVFFFLLGNNTSVVRFVAEKKYESRRGRILTAALALTLIQSLVVGLFIYFLHKFIPNNPLTDGKLLFLALLFGFCLTLRDLLDSFLRASSQFKRQAVLKCVEAGVIAMVFFSFYLIFGKDFPYYFYVFSFIVGALIFSALSWIFLRRRFSLFSWSDILLLLHYNKFLIIVGFGGMILGLEKILIGLYWGSEQLGIYSAYYTASQTVLSALALIFMGVFWPMVIEHKHNIEIIIKKLDILFYKYFIVWCFINSVNISVIMFFFGSEYPFDITLAILFSISSLFNIFFFVYLNLLKIDQIKRAAIISVIVYGTMVSSVFLIGDIAKYVGCQIIIYVIALFYIRRAFFPKFVFNKI